MDVSRQFWPPKYLPSSPESRLDHSKMLPMTESSVWMEDAVPHLMRMKGVVTRADADSLTNIEEHRIMNGDRTPGSTDRLDSYKNRKN